MNSLPHESSQSFQHEDHQPIFAMDIKPQSASFSPTPSSTIINSGFDNDSTSDTKALHLSDIHPATAPVPSSHQVLHLERPYSPSDGLLDQSLFNFPMAFDKPLPRFPISSGTSQADILPSQSPTEQYFSSMYQSDSDVSDTQAQMHGFERSALKILDELDSSHFLSDEDIDNLFTEAHDL